MNFPTVLGVLDSARTQPKIAPQPDRLIYPATGKSSQDVAVRDDEGLARAAEALKFSHESVDPSGDVVW